MKTQTQSAKFLAGALLATSALVAQAAPILVNGDFETGDFSGWTTYTNAGGVIGTPAVVSADVVQGTTSLAARLRAGEVTVDNSVTLGGGLSQTFSVGSNGLFLFQADVMAEGTPQYANADGGSFALFVDNVSVASFAAGEIAPSQLIRNTLSYTGLLSTGSHTLRLETTRRWQTSDNTPFQYFDNAKVTAVPEAGSVEMVLVGIAMVGGVQAWRRRVNKA